LDWVKKSPISRCERSLTSRLAIPARARSKSSVFEIAYQQPVFAQKQGIVASAGFAQSGLHFGPQTAMPLFVFLDPIGLDLQYEADTLHRIP